jgi:hypothetical protein
MTCRFFDPGSTACAAGIEYQKLAGGGAFTMVMRLPCIPISNRRGEEARPCTMYQENKDEMPTL